MTENMTKWTKWYAFNINQSQMVPEQENLMWNCQQLMWYLDFYLSRHEQMYLLQNA